MVSLGPPPKMPAAMVPVTGVAAPRSRTLGIRGPRRSCFKRGGGGCECPRRPPPGLLHVEVSVADRHDRVVGGCLEIGLPGLDSLPGCQGGEEGVGYVEDRSGADAGAHAEHQAAAAIVKDIARG